MNGSAVLWGATARNNACDQIIKWAGSTWEYYYYNSTVNAWVKEGVTPLAETTDTIKTGDTVLFRRAGRGATTDTASVPGEVMVLGGTKTVSTPKNGTVFMTYPWPVAMKVKDLSKYIDQSVWGRPSRDNMADQIIKWVGSDWQYYYYNSTVNAWIKDGVTPAEETTDEIAPGEGFLFRRSGRGANTDTVTFKGPEYKDAE